MYKPAPPKASRRTAIAGSAAFVLFLGFMLQQGIWYRDRPRVPNPATGEVIRAFDKGVIYISQRDLDLNHAIIAALVVLVAAFIICLELDQRKARPHA